MITRKCKRCNKEFIASRYEVNSGNGIYCSRTCARGNPKVIKVCIVCGNTFEIWKYKSDLGFGKYCSIKCKADNQKGKVKSDRYDATCKNCGNVFKVNVYRHRTKQDQYCSLSCFWKCHTKENHPSWRGGIWKGNSSHYCDKWTEKLREEIRVLFNRKCYICGNPEEFERRKLSVHHCDYNKSQGCKGTKWSLIPLCTSCHAKTNHNVWYWFCLLRDHWIYSYILFNDDITYEFTNGMEMYIMECK